MWPAAITTGLSEPLTGNGVSRRASNDKALWSRSPTSPIYPKLSPSLAGLGGVEAPSQQVLVVSVDGATSEQLSTNLQTGFNLINNYVGMVLLSMSYCFACCGWAALPLLALLTAYGGYTGSLIVMSYSTISREGETVPSYAKIGERACGAFGKWLVLVSSVVETIFAVVGMNVIVWQNAALLLPSLHLQASALVCILVSFPFNWLKNFSLLSFVSAFGFLCVLLICAVAGYQMASPDKDSPAAADHSLLEASGLPMAASIMLAGLTGHVSLPPMYCSMANPHDFHRTLAVSFIIMFLMYGWVGACGYAVFGDAGSVLLTSDMDEAKHGALDEALVALVLGGISFKLFCSVPMCIVVLTDIGETLWLEREGSPLGEQAVLRLRIALWTICTLAAVASYSSLQYLTAFIGVNSMLISVLLPILFYVLIHKDGMSNLEAIWFVSLFVISCAVTIFLSYVDIVDFLKSLKQ